MSASGDGLNPLKHLLWRVGLTPEKRFERHMAGIQSGRFVRRYGKRLMPALYEVFNPMPYEAAKEMEVELGIDLREKGYGVWQA